MTYLAFTLIVLAGSFAAGLLGALTGLGGGVVIVPMLAIGFGIDLRLAVGASLVSVIATSSGAAAAYVREGYTNLRLGMVLEIATAVGAIVGAGLAVLVPAAGVAVLFGVVLLYTAWSVLRPPPPARADMLPDALASRLRLHASYPSDSGPAEYHVHRVPAGMAVMGLGGALAGLTGLGAGVVKVLAMDRVMRVPFKVSTTTSNFMIGVTAATGAGVYLARGQIDPAICWPVVLGVTAGSMIGARFLARLRTPTLRAVFACVVLVLGFQMIYKGLSGGLS